MVFAIKLLLRLLSNFIPIDDEDLGRISGKAKEWALSFYQEPGQGEKPKHPIFIKIKEYADMWGVQILLLFVYLIAYDGLQKMFREDKNEEKPTI